MHLSSYDVILAPSSYHRTLLQQKDLTRGDHFLLLTKEAMLERLFFKIHHDRALLWLFQQGISLPKAQSMLPHLYFLKPHTHERIQEWMHLREALLNVQALTVSPLGKRFFDQKKILVMGYPFEDPEIVGPLKPLAKELVFEHLIPTKQPEFSLHVFLDTEAEVRYGLNALADQLKQGRKMEEVVIMRPSSEYLEPLKRLSRQYRIPIDFDESTPFSLTPIGIQTLHALERNESFESIEMMLGHFPDVHKIPLLQILATLKTLKLNPTQQVTWLAHQLQQTKVESPALEQAIRIKTSFVATHQWVWIPGFNQGQWPTVARDDDALSDELKASLGELTSKQVNQYEQQRSLLFLATSPQLFITAKRFHLGQAYELSSLIHESKVAIIQNPVYPIDYGREQALKQREWLKEKKTIYRLEDPYLATYSTQIKEEIKPYQYAFKPWENTFHDQWMKLSYSKLSEFYQCQFKYYLSKILQLESYDDMFYADLGSLMHNLFEKTQASDKDFEKLFDEQMKAFESKFPPRKRLIVEGLKGDILRVIQFNLNHRSKMQLETMVAEQEIKFTLKNNMGFSGKIDKIVVTTDGKEKYISLIDYKTGKEAFHEDEIALGWSLQLPIYAWLISKHKDFQTYQLIGLYIQHVLHDSLLTKEGADEEEETRKTLMLEGVSTEHEGPLSTFDPTYHESEFIKSMKITKAGVFHKHAKVRSKAQFDYYKTLAEQKVTYAVEHIQQGDFKINPIRFKTKNSCSYCPFRDVCFRKDKDVSYVSFKKETKHGS